LLNISKKNKADGFSAAKRSFLLSLISLLVIISMYIGTTYAWMTDTVTSGVNKIVSGNLDISLNIYSNQDNKYIPLENNNLFPLDCLWEPGSVKVAYIEIANDGNLPLNYDFKIEKSNEKNGVNAEGLPFALSDYLVFNIVKIDGADKFFANDEAAIAQCADIEKGFRDCSVQSESPLNFGDGGKQYYAIIVYMPDDETADSANYTSEIPIIQLNITLTAEQAPIE